MKRFLLIVLLFLPGCSRVQRGPAIGIGYVASNAANLRDKLAAQQITVATLKQGEKVTILERKRKWLHVRTAAGAEGWLDEHNIVGQDIFNRFEGLRSSLAAKPSQGLAHTRREVNLHLEPNRKSPTYYALKEEESCQVVAREVGERPPKPNQPKDQKVFEDWFLVHNSTSAGWGLASNIEMAVPDEVLQYAEGKRVVAWFVLDPGPEPEHPTILWATTSGMGLPYDFDSVRVFAWVMRKKHYETSYIEHGLQGSYPILVSKDPLGFTYTAATAKQPRQTRKFLLQGPRVRRVPVL